MILITSIERPKLTSDQLLSLSGLSIGGRESESIFRRLRRWTWFAVADHSFTSPAWQPSQPRLVKYSG